MIRRDKKLSVSLCVFSCAASSTIHFSMDSSRLDEDNVLHFLQDTHKKRANIPSCSHFPDCEVSISRDHESLRVVDR
jgi:hypothetical protein